MHRAADERSPIFQVAAEARPAGVGRDVDAEASNHLTRELQALISRRRGEAGDEILDAPLQQWRRHKRRRSRFTLPDDDARELGLRRTRLFGEARAEEQE